MPLGKKVRPSTASGKLETLHVPSIISELRSPGGKTIRSSRVEEVSDEFLTPRPSGSSGDREEIPEWLGRELLKQNGHRRSASFGDKAQPTARLHHNRGSTHDPYNLKHSDLINCLTDPSVSLDNLQKVKVAFEECQNGLKSVDQTHFRIIMKQCLGLHDMSNAQLEDLFTKIDYLGKGTIVWDEFCTYIQLEYTERKKCVTRLKQAAFNLPATIKDMCHGNPILQIQSTSDSTIITVREDGTVSYWSPELKLKKTKRIFPPRPVNRTSKHATNFIPMPQYNKLIIGTGSREIQLYELSSLEPYCQISALETIPLTVDYCYTGPDECYILYGDSQGCVNIILISSVGETLRLWKKLPKIENVPNITIDNAVISPNVTFIRWKVHQDWVTKVKYFQNMGAIVSSSNEESSALVIGCVLPSLNLEQQMRVIREGYLDNKAKKVHPNQAPQSRVAGDQRVFTMYKGAKTFDLCKKHNLLVTGGTDRIIRLWNPYLPEKPTGVLKGHSASVSYLCISSEDNQIFSVSMDNSVKIWDIQEQCCLFTAHPKASMIQGDMPACLYAPSLKTLFVGGDYIALLSLKKSPQHNSSIIVSHNEPVMCCGYSEEFRQVVSCSHGSVVKVWDFDTGHQVFEFGEAHGLSAITCMTFDPKGRRLVTGGRDGCLKIWNFNDGQCLKVLKKNGECPEVCDCSYLKVHRNPYVISVGWSRKIDIYSDTPEGSHHVQRPQPLWPDDQKNGHKDDIHCIAQSPPSLLATSSYDGEIIVWNVMSGHIQCRLLPPLQLGVDTSVPSLLFLRNRTPEMEFSTGKGLLSSGANGSINFWNVLNGGNFVCGFEISRLQEKITKLALTQEDILYAADKVGYIYVYNMKTILINPNQSQPKAENFWRAHTCSITGLQIVDHDQVVLTSSTDCTVRLWSSYGEFIGTFGQSDNWNIHISSSWKHPAVPYEVLTDPLSMPVDEILNIKTCSSHAVSTENTEVGVEELEAESHNRFRHSPPSLSDTDIEKDIERMLCLEEPGKWLRLEIFKQNYKPLNHGGPKVYQSLKYFDIVDPPAICVRPDLTMAAVDPIKLSTVEEESN